VIAKVVLWILGRIFELIKSDYLWKTTNNNIISATIFIGYPHERNPYPHPHLFNLNNYKRVPYLYNRYGCGIETKIIRTIYTPL
jgi:hypothetical protein